MKYIALLLVSLILANAVQDNQLLQEASLLGDELEQILKDSKLGRAILKLSELKSTIKQVDFSRLFIALDDLSASVQERKTEEAASLEQDYNQFLADSDFFGNQVTEFKTQVAQHQVDVQGLTQTRNELQNTLFNKGNQLADTKRSLLAVQSTLTKSERLFIGSNGEYDKAIQVVDKALEQLQQVKSSSFAEISREEVTTMATQFQRTFAQITSKVFFYEPLVDELVQISQAKITLFQRFSDQEAIQKVIKLLNKLRAELVASKNAQQGTYQSEKTDNEALVAQYTHLVETLATEVIPELQTDIETKAGKKIYQKAKKTKFFLGQIRTKQSLLNDASDNLKTAQDNLDFANARWTARQVQNKALVGELNNEAQAIAAAIAALERGGIRRPQ